MKPPCPYTKTAEMKKETQCKLCQVSCKVLYDNTLHTITTHHFFDLIKKSEERESLN